jgi:nicotinate-nucleotide pyrophosphorylase
MYACISGGPDIHRFRGADFLLLKNFVDGVSRVHRTIGMGE